MKIKIFCLCNYALTMNSCYYILKVLFVSSTLFLHVVSFAQNQQKNVDWIQKDTKIIMVTLQWTLTLRKKSRWYFSSRRISLIKWSEVISSWPILAVTTLTLGPWPGRFPPGPATTIGWLTSETRGFCRLSIWTGSGTDVCPTAVAVPSDEAVKVSPTVILGATSCDLTSFLLWFQSNFNFEVVFQAPEDLWGRPTFSFSFLLLEADGMSVFLSFSPAVLVGNTPAFTLYSSCTNAAAVKCQKP